MKYCIFFNNHSGYHPQNNYKPSNNIPKDIAVSIGECPYIDAVKKAMEYVVDNYCSLKDCSYIFDGFWYRIDVDKDRVPKNILFNRDNNNGCYVCFAVIPDRRDEIQHDDNINQACLVNY